MTTHWVSGRVRLMAGWAARGLLIFLVANLCWSQTGTGNIQGTVKDTSGGAVPGAKVMLVHTATNRQYATETSGAGFYLFPSIELGDYQLTVESVGMETWKGQLTLVAGHIAEVAVTLKVGATSAEITVRDVTPLLTTNSATLATVVERERIEQLPLNGRSITGVLLMTTPGLESGNVPWVYGVRFGSEMLQDGAPLVNRDTGSLPGRLPGLDSVGEFVAETNNSSAKMNRPGSLILSTRSGTNEVHGSLFETARNSGLGVARARTDYYTKPPHLVRNEFGASLGGPIFIPKIYNGKNKTFFFVSYEAKRSRSASTLSATEATMPMRGGDFSQLYDANGRFYTIYDPLTTGSAAGNYARMPFANNQIPISRESPLAKYLYSVTVAPTTADNPLVSNNYFGPAISNSSDYTLTTRIDHRISDRDRIFGRFSHNKGSSLGLALGYPVTLDGQASAQLSPGQNDTGVGSWNHTFSPTFFSETLITVSKDYGARIPSTGLKEITSTLGLPNPFKAAGFPRITGTGFSQGYGSTNYNLQYALVMNGGQSFTKVKGRHELQFGGSYRYERDDTLPDQQEMSGTVNFSTLATSLYDPASGAAYLPKTYTGFDAANMFLGVATYSSRFNRSWYRIRVAERALYFQDNFRVNPRLTLNLGLRYENNNPGTEANDSFVGFDVATHAVVLNRSIADLTKLGVVVPSLVQGFQKLGMKIETAKEANLPQNLIYPNNFNFWPRAGFAYRVGSSAHPLVVRGGYAVFSYPEWLRGFNGMGEFSAPSAGTFSQNLNNAAISPDGLPNYLLRSAPAIIAGVNSANALPLDAPTGLVPGSAAVYYPNPRQPTARAQGWNFTLERALWANTTIKASYVGTHGSDMCQNVSYNDNPPDYIWYKTAGLTLPTGYNSNVVRRPYDNTLYGEILEYSKTGWSNNSSFQAEIQRRYSKGYAFQWFYVMSNANDVGGYGWASPAVKAINQFLPGTVPTDQHARNKLLNYKRQTSIPKHRVNWNWLVDLPIGKGKLLGKNMNGVLDRIVGGWQLAGFGSVTSRWVGLTSSNWGPVGNVQVYGTKYPVQDCTSGVCYDAYLYVNGYISSRILNAKDAAGKCTGICGVPASYQPYNQPLITWGQTTAPPNMPAGTNLSAYWDTNTAWVPLQNGTVARTTYNTGLNPLQNQYILGPFSWSLNASLFKVIPIREKMFLRFNGDFFSVLNRPGVPQPGGNGVINMRSSANTPRVLQLTLRLQW